MVVRPAAGSLAGFVLALCLLAGSAANATAPAKKSAQPDEFLAFDAITVSVLERMRVKGFLTVEFGLYVTDKRLRHAIETNKRTLNDAYVRALADYGADIAKVTVPPDIDGIADRLQSVTDAMLGKKGARVLLSQLQLRKLR
jgi:flagellar basal body-associated protein FliL